MYPLGMGNGGAGRAAGGIVCRGAAHRRAVIAGAVLLEIDRNNCPRRAANLPPYVALYTWVISLFLPIICRA